MAQKLHKNLRKSLKFGYLFKNFHFYYRGIVPNLSKLPTQQDLFLARNSLFFFFSLSSRAHNRICHGRKFATSVQPAFSFVIATMGNFRPTPPCDLETGPHKARPPPPPSPHFHPPAPKSWFSWLVPLIFAANIAMFVYTMYYNDCPAHGNKDDCLFHKYLGRFSFQPFKENALLGPSSNT